MDLNKRSGYVKCGKEAMDRFVCIDVLKYMKI